MQDWTFLGTLPSVDDFVFMKRMFVVLMGRITSKRMQWMKDYNVQRDCVVDEVEHKYAAEMRQQSDEVHSHGVRTCRGGEACAVGFDRVLHLQHSLGLRNLYEVTQIDEIINWLHELIAGVDVIKQRDPAEKQASKQRADAARTPRAAAAAAAAAAGSDGETGKFAFPVSYRKFNSSPSILPLIRPLFSGSDAETSDEGSDSEGEEDAKAELHASGRVCCACTR